MHWAIAVGSITVTEQRAKVLDFPAVYYYTPAIFAVHKKNMKIKKVAAEAGIPLVENVPLARTLYKTVKVGQFIPRALYQAVAEVLAYVYRLKNRRL